jgi:hypothetical protein
MGEEQGTVSVSFRMKNNKIKRQRNEPPQSIFRPGAADARSLLRFEWV